MPDDNISPIVALEAPDGEDPNIAVARVFNEAVRHVVREETLGDRVERMARLVDLLADFVDFDQPEVLAFQRTMRGKIRELESQFTSDTVIIKGLYFNKRGAACYALAWALQEKASPAVDGMLKALEKHMPRMTVLSTLRRVGGA